MRNGSYFYIVPSGIVKSEVSDGAKLTYAVILGLSNQYGYCFARNETLAEIRQTSESSVRRHIKELIDAMLIQAEYNDRNDRRLTPCIFPVEREKNAKNAEIMRQTAWEDEIDDVLDTIWKKMR